MPEPPATDSQRATQSGLSLRDGFDLSGLSREQLWWRQVAVGGVLSLLDLEAYLAGLMLFNQHTHDVLAQALNEHFFDHGATHPVVY